MTQNPTSQSETGAENSPKRGRPAGSRNQPRTVVLVRPAWCPKCGSSKRTPYRLVNVREMPGYTSDGQRYERIVYRDCRCKDCGQLRREAHFENDGGKDAEQTQDAA
jgi:predicted Zn-ribbon and HTH transcriptional regulator